MLFILKRIICIKKTYDKKIHVVCVYYNVVFHKYCSNWSNSCKNSLTNQGAFINPSFEFTTEFDTEKDSNNANNTVRGVLIKGLNYSKAENTNKETKFFGWYGVPNNIPAGEKDLL